MSYIIIAILCVLLLDRTLRSRASEKALDLFIDEFNDVLERAKEVLKDEIAIKKIKNEKAKESVKP